jgi:hypothetical protein
MKLETLLIVLGLLLLALLSSAHERQPPQALVVDGVLPPNRGSGTRLSALPGRTPSDVAVASMPLLLPVHLSGGL